MLSSFFELCPQKRQNFASARSSLLQFVQRPTCKLLNMIYEKAAKIRKLQTSTFSPLWHATGTGCCSAYSSGLFACTPLLAPLLGSHVAVHHRLAERHPKTMPLCARQPQELDVLSVCQSPAVLRDISTSLQPYRSGSAGSTLHLGAQHRSDVALAKCRQV